MNYLEYANQGATRRQPLSPQLTQALGFLPDLGVTARVFSGGQPSTGSNRVGSTRHDHGDAADVLFFQGGRQLDWRNPEDVPIYQQIVRRGRAAGLTGFGAGENYMTPGSMHIGFGAPAVWGADGSGANAPQWLRDAYQGAPAGQAPTNMRMNMTGAPQMAMQPTQPQGLLGQLGIQRRDPTAQGETALPFYQRSRFGNTMGNLAMAFNSLRQRPDDNIPRIVTGQRATREQDAANNRTIEWLRSQPNGAHYAEMAEAMGPQAAFQAYQADAERARRSAATAAELARGEIREVDGSLVRVMPDGTVQEIYGGDQSPDVSDVANLRKEFTGLSEVQDFQPIARQYANIVSAAATGTGPADITLVFSYMKLIDPSSSVQQGEQATAASAGGTSAQLRGLYNSLLGQGSLDAVTRDQFVAAATDLYNNAKAPYDQAVEYYTGLSTQLGYDPTQVIGFDRGYGGSPYVPTGTTSAPPLTPSASAAGVTQQQWDNMTPQQRSAFP